MFLTISLENFFVKRLMGTPLDWKFLTHDFFFQFRVWPPGGTHIKNYFGTIKDLSIWFFGNKGIFVSQNFYGHTMVWSSISSDFFDFARFDRKSIKIGYKPRKVPISKTASLRSKAFRYDSLETRELFWVKTLMGIEVPFRDFFFVFVSES